MATSWRVTPWNPRVSFKVGFPAVANSPAAVETERLLTLMKTTAEKAFGHAGPWTDFVGGLPYGRSATVDESVNGVVCVSSDRASCPSGLVINVDDHHSSKGRCLLDVRSSKLRPTSLWRRNLYWWRRSCQYPRK